MHKKLHTFVFTSLLAAAVSGQVLMQASAGTGDFPPWQQLKGVALTKVTTGNSSTTVGSEFDYAVAIHNRTDASATVTVTDKLASELQLVGQPTVVVITPTVSPTAPAVQNNTITWSGSLSASSKAVINIKVKLIACPANEPGKPRGVGNTAVMVTGNGVSVASVAFAPAGCTGPPHPAPPPTPPPASGADIGVRKFGRLHPDWDFPERGWRASWFVGYGNRGSLAATDATLLDAPSANQTLDGIRSAPLITPATTANGLLFGLGAVQPGRGGGLLLRTSVPFSTAAGTQLTNRATVSATNDTSLANNASGVTLTIPLLAPVITYPRSGLTFTGTLTLRGKAQTGNTADVFIDGQKIGASNVEPNGDWSLPVQLADGVHVIFARNAGNTEEDGWGEGRHSNVVVLKVNSNLIFDPISLTFAGPDGNRSHPRGWLGWHDEVNWYVGLQPSTTYTVGVRICCAGAAVTLTVPSAGDVTLTDGDGDLTYSGNFTTGAARQLVSGPIKLCVTANGITQCGSGRVVPVWRRPNCVVVITPDGFDPPRLSLSPGDVVEFVNMSDDVRAISTSRNLNAAAMGVESADAGNDAVRLEVGESFTVQVDQAQTFYNADNPNQTATLVPGGNGVYLPVLVR
jgi:plastocyanin